MMSMVTPPVALAGYAAASIAGTNIMATSFAAFRFALVGFTLPYIFVYRPELLMLTPAGETAGPLAMLVPVAIGTLGVLCFASGITGQLRTALTLPLRVAMFAAAALLLAPGPTIALAGPAGAGARCGRRGPVRGDLRHEPGAVNRTGRPGRCGIRPGSAGPSPTPSRGGSSAGCSFLVLRTPLYIEGSGRRWLCVR